VIEQVKNLSRTTIVQRSWHQRQYPHLHGWVFDLHTGLINSIVEILPGAEVDPIYRYEFEEITKKQDDLAVHFKH
jgi:carbonic anhydrase